MHQNKSGFVTHALGGFDALRRLLASGVAHECRTPGASAWALTAGQVARAGVRLAGVVVRGTYGVGSCRWINVTIAEAQPRLGTAHESHEDQERNVELI